MFKRILRRWLLDEPNVPAVTIEAKPEKFRGGAAFSSDLYYLRMMNREEAKGQAFDKIFQKIPIYKNPAGVAFDTGDLGQAVGAKANFINNAAISDPQALWFASQSFIGYQLCAVIAQHWLVSKACLMPAKDAVRNGWEITSNDGSDVDPEIFDAMRRYDVTFNLTNNLMQFVQMGRVFGIRVALFVVDSDDPLYYEKPFNIDGVLPNSYRGISQIDPYWLAPQLDGVVASDPFNINFYNPTWWQVGTLKIHRSHLVIFKTEEVADILKPTYLYGGVSVPQKIYERVYAAERTANEAPMLALSKRTDVLNADMAEAVLNADAFAAKMQLWCDNRDNYGVNALGLEETLTRFDTTLSDLDAVIMTQYQIVAAAANVPAVKLLGTSPKGFNTTGEFEEASYHEELESIQAHDLTPMIERHHLLLIKSVIAPEFNIEPFATTVKWNSLDSMTAKEQAELNKVKADMAVAYSSTGAIDAEDIRNVLIADPQSGYSGIPTDVPEPDDQLADDEDTDDEASNNADTN